MFSPQKGGLLPGVPCKVASIIRMFESGDFTPDTPVSTITDKSVVQSGGGPEYGTRHVSIQESHVQEHSISDSINQHSDTPPISADQSREVLDHKEPNKQEEICREPDCQERTVTTTGRTQHKPSTEQGSTEICTPNLQGNKKWNTELSQDCCTRDSVNNDGVGTADDSSGEGDTPDPSTTDGGSTEAKPGSVLDLRQLKEGLKAAKPERELKRELWTIIETISRLSIYPPEVDQDGNTVGDPDMTEPDAASAKRSTERLPGYPAEQEMISPVFTWNTDTKPEVVQAPTDNSDNDSLQSRGDPTDSTSLIHTSSGAVYRMLALSPHEQREPPVKPDVIQLDVDSFKRSRNNDVDPECMDQTYDDVEMDQRSDGSCEESIYDNIK